MCRNHGICQFFLFGRTPTNTQSRGGSKQGDITKIKKESGSGKDDVA